MRDIIFQKILRFLQPILRDKVFKIRSGPARGLYRRYGQGFKPNIRKTAEETHFGNLDLFGQTIYDVGSYIGIYTLFFARAVGAQGVVVAFEPDPDNFTELEKNILLNGFQNVRVLQTGVSDHPGEMELRRDQVYPSRSKLMRVGANRDQDTSRTELVRVDSLDHLQQVNSLPDPDLVKIDVEGSEMEVLLGMQELVQRCKPKLHIEIHGTNPDLLTTLMSWGYSIFHLEAGEAIENSIPNGSPSTYHVFCD